MGEKKLLSGACLEVLGQPGEVAVAAFAPDCSRILIARQGSLALTGSGSQEIWRRPLAEPAEEMGVSTLGGRSLAVTAGHAHLFDGKGEPAGSAPRPPGSVSVRLSPDGLNLGVLYPDRITLLEEARGGAGHYAVAGSLDAAKVGLPATDPLVRFALGYARQPVAVLSRQGTVALVERRGTLVWRFEYQRPFQLVSMNPVATVIVAASSAGAVVCLTREQQVLFAIDAKEKITAIALASSSGHVAVGTESGLVFLVNRGGEVVWEERVGAPLRRLALAANGDRALMWTGAGQVRVYSVGGSPVSRVVYIEPRDPALAGEAAAPGAPGAEQSPFEFIEFVRRP